MTRYSMRSVGSQQGEDAAGTAYDAVVVGGGFYGVCLASYLSRERGLSRIRLLEREPALMSRASLHNQARVHNGYHYPRSFTTAFRSRVNLPRFVADWPQAVKTDFIGIYAIARRNSKVSARQFVNFCRGIGATLSPASTDVAALFDRRLVEAVFEVEEWAFDAAVLADWAKQELASCGVDVTLSTRARSVRATPDGLVVTATTENHDGCEQLQAPVILNCTYAGLNQLNGEFKGITTGLKHEITEMALLEVPEPLRNLGVTLMDGPFYSLMPFPSRGLHTISHVRYTPHASWVDQMGKDPYDALQNYAGSSRASWMIRDASRYMPSIRDARYVDSALEVKTVLLKNESDDGRPILVEKHAELPGFFSVLGGKLDNIYDVIERLDMEPL